MKRGPANSNVLRDVDAIGRFADSGAMRLAVAFKARALVGLRHRGSEELKNLCLFGELSWPLGSARNRATGGFLFIHTTSFLSVLWEMSENQIRK